MAEKNSFNPSASKAQSKRDLAPKGGERVDDNRLDADGKQPQKDSEGKGWKHWSDVSRQNTYTGNGGPRWD